MIEEQVAVRSGRKFLDIPTPKGIPLIKARPGVRDMCRNPDIRDKSKHISKKKIKECMNWSKLHCL